MFTDDAATSWYMIFLSALSMGLALATLGLVHRWGQRVPQWSRCSGSSDPARPVVLVALTGGWLLVAICVYFLLNQRFHLVQSGWVGIGADEPVHPPPGWEVLRYYAPLLAWGPWSSPQPRTTTSALPRPSSVIKRFASDSAPFLTQTSWSPGSGVRARFRGRGGWTRAGGATTGGPLVAS
ncbi:hypothetical protein NKG94_50025 [Micromonospora sp. M12]